MPTVPSDPTKVVRITRLEENCIEVNTLTAKPSILVLSEKWDPNWKAWLDGKSVKILRANFLMRAIELPPGNHTVLMEYRPSLISTYISCVSMGIFAVLGIVWAFRRSVSKYA